MIRITDDYVIDLDSMGYTVERDEHREVFEKITGKNKHVYSNLAYFGKIEYAVKYVAEQIFKDKVNSTVGDVSLADAIKEFQKAYKFVADSVERNIP